MIRIDFKKNKEKESIQLNKDDKDFVSLSIDQATSKSGYSITKNGELEVYGLINTTKEEDKIYKIKEYLKYLINSYNPDIVVLENVQYQSNPQTLILLSKLLGVLEYTAKSMDKEVMIIPPKTWKSGCGIKGKRRKEQKKETVKFIKNNYNINVPEDIADAISINHYIKEVICNQ